MACPLLILWDSFLVLYLGFDIIDAVGPFYLKGNGFPSESFYKDLHAIRIGCSKYETKEY